MVTGFKLANPKLFRQMWADGRNQFLPFFVTVAAIVLTDLLIGILIGLAVALVFILQSNLRSPLRRIAERHVGGEVMRVELGNHLSFLNRASLIELLHGMPHGSHVVLVARNTVYMDHDIRDLVREFETEIAPAHDIDVSLVGFRDRYDFDDRITYVDVTTREVQDQATPEDVLQMLVDGNERFVRGQPVTRDPRRHVDGTQNDHYPLAVVLACTDARIATEMIFDVGLGDLFSVRVAGNVASEEALGSMEYGCAMAGAKLLLVLGHTRCGAVTATVDHVVRGPAALAPGDLENLGTITGPIAESVGAENETVSERHAGNREFVERVTVLNVRRTMREIRDRSATLRRIAE